MKPLVQRSLLVAALSLFIVTAAGPQWGHEQATTRHKGEQVMVVLDISPSMRACDVMPDRLTQAKHAIRKLLKLTKGGRIGLVVFSGMSVLRCPLTCDYEAFLWFLESVSPADIPVHGTDIGRAIRMACSAFTKSGEEKNGCILLVTDGEDHAEGVEQALAEGCQKGINIHVLGVGSDGGCPIPLMRDEDGFKKGSNGEVIISKLNEPLLRHVAAKTGGLYVHAGANRSAIAEICAEVIEQQSNIATVGGGLRGNLKNPFYWFLLVGLLLFVWSVLTDGVHLTVKPFARLLRLKTAIIAFLFLALMWASAAAETLTDKAAAGARLYKEGKYEDALQKFNEAKEIAPQDGVIDYNLGNINYTLEHFKKARGNWLDAIAKSDQPELRQKAYYNIGNAFYREGRYAEAAQHYKLALQLNPEDYDATFNLTIAEHQLELQKKRKKHQQSKNARQDKTEHKAKHDIPEERKINRTADSKEKKKESKQLIDRKKKTLQATAEGRDSYKEALSGKEARRWLNTLKEGKYNYQALLEEVNEESHITKNDW